MTFLGMDFATMDFHSWVAYVLIVLLLVIIGLIVGGALLMTLVRIYYKLKREEEAFEQDYGSDYDNNVTSFIKFLRRDRDFEIVNIMKSASGIRKIGICLEGGVGDPTITGDPGIFVRRVKENSAAENKLFPGDRILSVNDEQVTRVSLRQAERLIRDAQGMVKFLVKRAPLRQQRINDAYDEYRKDCRNVFTKQQLEEIEDGFSVYDKTSKGVIKTSAVFEVVRSLGYNLHEAEVWVYMNELGFTANPKITLQDFVKLMHLIVTEHESYQNDIELAYSLFEDDEGVCLTIDKLKMALERMSGRNRVKQYEINEIIGMVNSHVSKGGKIDINGFKRLVMPTIKMY